MGAPEAVAVARVVGQVRRRRDVDRVRRREHVAEHVVAQPGDEAPRRGQARHHPAVNRPELGARELARPGEAVNVGVREHLAWRGHELAVTDREPADDRVQLVAVLRAVRRSWSLLAIPVHVLVREDADLAGEVEQLVVEVHDDGRARERDVVRP